MESSIRIQEIEESFVVVVVVETGSGLSPKESAAILVSLSGSA